MRCRAESSSPPRGRVPRGTKSVPENVSVGITSAGLGQASTGSVGLSGSRRIRSRPCDNRLRNDEERESSPPTCRCSLVERLRSSLFPRKRNSRSISVLGFSPSLSFSLYLSFSFPLVFVQRSRRSPDTLSKSRFFQTKLLSSLCAIVTLPSVRLF